MNSKTATVAAFVYSTLAGDQIYLNYKAGGGDLPVPVGTGVFIKGGTGVAGKKNLLTPRGVVTPITGEELAYLAENPLFALHKKNEFIVVEGSEMDPERVASTMNNADPSRQLGDGDFADVKEDEDGHTDRPTRQGAPRRGGRNQRKTT